MGLSKSMSFAYWHFSSHSTCHILLILLYLSPVLFTKLHLETIEWEEKDFLHMAASAYHVISTEVENHIFKPIEFLDTSAFINNPHWQSSGILIFLCKYYIVISDTLVGSFLDVLFLLLAVILPELHEKPRRKNWITEKSPWKNLLKEYYFFDCTPSILCLFVAFFVYSFPLSNWLTCEMAPIKIYSIVMGGILCDDIMSKLSKTWKSPTI